MHTLVAVIPMLGAIEAIIKIIIPLPASQLERLTLEAEVHSNYAKQTKTTLATEQINEAHCECATEWRHSNANAATLLLP